jgi:hypothetical protein
MFLLTADGITTKVPYTLEELRRENPGTSFPAFMSGEELAEWGVFAVEEQSPPAFNEQTESIELGAPVLVDGKWVREWNIFPAVAEEVEMRTVAKAELVRTERNRLLAASDYTQLADFPSDSQIKEAITEYRRALRDLPTQAGFPWAVVWPLPNLEQT